MRPAIIGDEISQDLSEVLALMDRHDVRALELRNVWDLPPHRLSDDQARAIRRASAARGIEIIGLDAPVGKRRLPTTSAEIQEERALLSRCLELADLAGAGFVRCFTFYRAGDPDVAAAAEALGRVVEGIDRRGIEIVIETGMRTNTPTIATLIQVLEVIDDPTLGVLWDPGNSVFSGIERDPFPAEWDLGRGRIRHVHVKDPWGSQEYVRLGDGDLDWSAIVKRLAKDDYRGHLSLETHWRPHRILSQPERDEPWGSSFSERGAEASGECLAILNRMLGEARG